MTPGPTVSVLLPTFNYGRFLGDAIESVLSQSFSNLELIIADNHSTDETSNVVMRYLGDSRVRYIRRETNVGMVPNFNMAMQEAKGKYIKFIMGDDKFHPDCLQKMVAVLEQHPGVVMVSSASEAFGDVTTLRPNLFSDVQKGELVIREALKDGKGNFIGEPTTVMFRASNLSVGTFSSDFVCLTDLDLWLRQLSLGDIYFIPEVLSYFRVHTAQSSFANDYKNWFDEYRFYKNAKANKAYGIDMTELNIDKVIRKTALKSAGALYPLAGGLLQAKKRKMFFEALNIARKERVVTSSIVVQFSKKSKRTKLSGS